MAYIGKDPNGINQISQSLLSIDVNGLEQVTISTESVDINTKLTVEGSISASQITGSGAGLYDIPSEALTADAASKILSGSEFAQISPDNGLVVSTDTRITGSLFVSNSLDVNGDVEVTGSIFVSQSLTVGGIITGDGSGITNIDAGAVGDIDRLKSGSVEAIISPDKGLTIKTGASVDNFLIVSGSQTIKQN